LENKEEIRKQKMEESVENETRRRSEVLRYRGSDSIGQMKLNQHEGLMHKKTLKEMQKKKNEPIKHEDKDQR